MFYKKLSSTPWKMGRSSGFQMEKLVLDDENAYIIYFVYQGEKGMEFRRS